MEDADEADSPRAYAQQTCGTRLSHPDEIVGTVDGAARADADFAHRLRPTTQDGASRWERSVGSPSEAGPAAMPVRLPAAAYPVRCAASAWRDR